MDEHEELLRKLNDVLDVLESELTKFAAGKELHNVTIERWRWDEPCITLTWHERDQQGEGWLYKNIHFCIELPRPEHNFYSVKLEANAWADLESQEGKGRLRRWAHWSPADTGAGELFEAASADDLLAAAKEFKKAGRISKWIEKAYDAVSRWDSANKLPQEAFLRGAG